MFSFKVGKIKGRLRAIGLPPAVSARELHPVRHTMSIRIGRIFLVQPFELIPHFLVNKLDLRLDTFTLGEGCYSGSFRASVLTGKFTTKQLVNKR